MILPAGTVRYRWGGTMMYALIKENRGADLASSHGYILDLIVWDSEKSEWFEVVNVREGSGEGCYQ